MIRTLIILVGLTSAAASAQVQIGRDGIRAGGTTIDRSGIHAPQADIRDDADDSETRASRRTIVVNGTTRDVDCRNGELVLNGNNSRFTVSNCSRVTIAGNHNDLHVNFSTPGRLTVVGNDNRVAWHKAGDIQVRVTNPGNNNSVVRH